jgi:peptide-methionine (S)-S-oxide reductase
VPQDGDWTTWRSPYDDGRDKTLMVDPGEALPGGSEPVPVTGRHLVLGTPLTPPFPAGLDSLVVAMGCFWGAERRFWTVPGVYTTAAGFAGGYTANPTYEQVCSARTGHAESVLVVFDPGRVGLDELLRVFWEGHDPTQGMRQGDDVGTQYRSVLFHRDGRQREVMAASRERYGRALRDAGHGPVTTELRPLDAFHHAEEFHQQTLAREPDGYCGAGGTGVGCPTGLGPPAGP